MEWVTRSRGVVFVPAPAGARREAAAVQSVLPLDPVTPVSLSAPGALSAPGSVDLPEAIVRTLREVLPDVDDSSVKALIDACRERAPDATIEEINYFVRIKADLMQRMGTVKAPMGFLKTSVARCFEGESFRQFRAAEVRRREAAAQRELEQEEELRRFQEEQRAVLADPKASEEERRFARRYLGLEEVGG